MYHVQPIADVLELVFFLPESARQYFVLAPSFIQEIRELLVFIDPCVEFLFGSKTRVV
jgi:hypothetical protein